ncbi:unnamed protein product [Polarella glacialis]|uniref:ATP-dependent DNA helicase n=1 Tax=Polarella glacialis TaxID=89957 RepID=A0A813JK79_POLGL|nr:unnamed protein product [Polarella glacialis]
MPLIVQASVSVPTCSTLLISVETATLGELEDEARSVLSFFGHNEPREGQWDVVKACLQQRDIAVYWATGAGKSLCYQLPAVLAWKRNRGVVIVIEPTISLMHDQVVGFNSHPGSRERRGPRACLLGSAQEDPLVEQAAISGEYCLVYITPESLTGKLLDAFEPLYAEGSIAMMVVDEADRIPMWGHDFRTSFRDLWWVREKYPNIPVMAASGSASPTIQRDIAGQLALRTPFESIGNMFRRNLCISVWRKETFNRDMERMISHVTEDGFIKATIVYVPTKPSAKKVQRKLQELLGDLIKVGLYTGETSIPERRNVYDAFFDNTMPVIVCTVAFGMGIDKPDIENIFHYSPPRNVEDYMQQIGRAGRDGRLARCIMIMAHEDWRIYENGVFAHGLKDWPDEDVAWYLNSTERFQQLAAGRSCRWEALLSYFGRSAAEPLGLAGCGTCDVCRGKRSEGQGDAEAQRVFTKEARLLLSAVHAAQDLNKGHADHKAILQIAAGKYEPSSGAVPRRYRDAMSRVDILREAVKPGRRSQIFLKSLLDMVHEDGYVRRVFRKVAESDDGDRYVWQLSEYGKAALKWGYPVHLHPNKELKLLELPEDERREVKSYQKGLKSKKDEICKLFAEFQIQSVDDPDGMREIAQELRQELDALLNFKAITKKQLIQGVMRKDRKSVAGKQLYSVGTSLKGLIDMVSYIVKRPVSLRDFEITSQRQDGKFICMLKICGPVELQFLGTPSTSRGGAQAIVVRKALQAIVSGDRSLWCDRYHSKLTAVQEAFRAVHPKVLSIRSKQ